MTPKTRLQEQSKSGVSGDFRELLSLFVPILLMTFTNCLYLFIEKLLLARLSIQAMEAAVNAAYACQIFQLPCVALAMMAQVCVGRWRGSQELHMIGPGVWQFIWFSFLSMLITIPTGLFYGTLYFQNTNLEEIVFPYYYYLVAINFLYPLAATLTCFFIGLGKTSLVVCASIGSQLLKLTLAYLLIFGWDKVFPGLGIMGGVISTLLAQGGFCLLLLLVFLNRYHASLYHSRYYHFQPKLFWECIYPGLLRAINRVLSAASWASIAHLMAAKGGDYLLVLSIGGTLFIFLPFLGDAICQAQTTVVSQILGARTYPLLGRAFLSGAFLVFFTISLLSVPLILFPFQTFHYLFPTIIIGDLGIQKIFFGIWTCFAFFTFGFLPTSYVLAFKDTKFSLFMGALNWINGFLLMYIAIEKIQIIPDHFWLALTLMHMSTAFFYYLRMRWLQSRILSHPIYER